MLHLVHMFFFNLILWCKITLNWHPPARRQARQFFYVFSVSPIESPIHGEISTRSKQTKVIFNWWIPYLRNGGAMIPSPFLGLRSPDCLEVLLQQVPRCPFFWGAKNSSNIFTTTRYHKVIHMYLNIDHQQFQRVFQHLFEISRYLDKSTWELHHICASPNKHLFSWR